MKIQRLAIFGIVVVAIALGASVFFIALMPRPSPISPEAPSPISERLANTPSSSQSSSSSAATISALASTSKKPYQPAFNKTFNLASTQNEFRDTGSRCEGAAPPISTGSNVITSGNGAKLMIQTNALVPTTPDNTGVPPSQGFQNILSYVSPNGKSEILYALPRLIDPTGWESIDPTSMQLSPTGRFAVANFIGNEWSEYRIYDTSTCINILDTLPITPDFAPQEVDRIDHFIWAPDDAWFAFHSVYDPNSDLTSFDGIFVYQTSTQQLQIVAYEFPSDESTVSYKGYANLRLVNKSDFRFDELRFTTKNTENGYIISSSTLIASYNYDLMTGELTKSF